MSVSRLQERARALQSKIDRNDGEKAQITERLKEEFGITPSKIESKLKSLKKKLETDTENLNEMIEAYEQEFKSVDSE